MNDAPAVLEDEALNFIQHLDVAAFEAFIRGDASAENYRKIADQIGNIQRLTVEILSSIDRNT
jgi:hypothetical protein